MPATNLASNILSPPSRRSRSRSPAANGTAMAKVSNVQTNGSETNQVI